MSLKLAAALEKQRGRVDPFPCTANVCPCLEPWPETHVETLLRLPSTTLLLPSCLSFSPSVSGSQCRVLQGQGSEGPEGIRLFRDRGTEFALPPNVHRARAAGSGLRVLRSRRRLAGAVASRGLREFQVMSSTVPFHVRRRACREPVYNTVR